MRRLLLSIMAVAAILFPPLALAGGARVAPDFSLNPKELRAMISTLPPAIQDRILARPEAFFHLIAQVLDEPADLFILVDKSHPLDADYEPPDLVSLAAYRLSASRDDIQLRKSIMPAVVEMAGAALADGAALIFSSGYRSYEYQSAVYDREVKAYGREAAERESARPGMSQHQLGTAVDFGSITDAFAETRAGKWLLAHAEEYGFSLSYPQGYEKVTGYRWESWHYRFITKPGALLQKEFFQDIQQYLLEFLDSHRAALEAKRVKAR